MRDRRGSTGMKVKIRPAGPCRRALEIEVDASVLEAERKTIVEEFRSGTTIPGFRKGKAPASIVERKYADAIQEELRKHMLPKCYREAIASEGVDAVAVVDVKNVSMEDGKGLSFTATVDIPPKFKTPKYKGIPVKGEPMEPSEERVDDAIREVREKFSTFEDADDRAATTGDAVKVDFTATVDERPLTALAKEAAWVGKGADFWMMIGDAREAIPGLSKGIDGMKVGETREVSVEFPGDYRIESLRGRSASYDVSLKEVKARKLPELDEEFLKTLKVGSAAELREKARNGLRSAAEQAETRRRKNVLAEHLLKHTNIDVPESLVSEETRRIVQDIVMSNTSRGVSKEEIEKERDGILAEATRSATERVKLGYILERIADEAGISVGEDEVGKHIEIMAERHGADPAVLRANLEQRDGLDDVRKGIKSEKALDYALSLAKIKKR